MPRPHRANEWMRRTCASLWAYRKDACKTIGTMGLSLTRMSEGNSFTGKWIFRRFWKADQSKENKCMAEIITRDSEEFKELTGWIKRTGKAVEDATARIRPTIADEHYLTGDDVCAMLHISRRTLQTLRDEKVVPYTTIGGKLLYPESGLYEVLKKNYRDFRRFRK